MLTLTGTATMQLIAPTDPSQLSTALWTALATCGPWSSGPVYRYDPRMAVAAAWEALGAAMRASGPPKHGWSTERAEATLARFESCDCALRAIEEK